MARRKPRDWFVCPICGEKVPANALSCPECGSDDRTGWSSETEYDGLDLSEPDEPSEEDAEGEAPDRPSTARMPIWGIAAVVLLLAALLVLALLRVF